MAETSYYWDGTTTGDATLAPYGEDEFLALLFRHLFLQWPATQGPIDGYDEMLEVEVTATFATMNPGAALVYGFMYISDDDESFAIATGNYYRVVLRVSWAAKTVRAALLSSAVGLPALTQTAGTTWEINLADIDYSGVSPVLTDRRVFCRPNGYRYPRVAAIGSELVSGTTMVALDNPSQNVKNLSKPHHNLMMQSGVARWTGGSASTGSVTVTFPEAFGEMTLGGFVNSPVVIVQVVDDGILTPSQQNTLTKTTQTATTFTIYWKSEGNSRTQIDFYWFAIGVAGPTRNFQPSPSSSLSPSASPSPSSSESPSQSPSASLSPSASASPSSSESPSGSASESPSASPSVTPLVIIYDEFTDLNGTALPAHVISPVNTVSASWGHNYGSDLSINGNAAYGVIGSTSEESVDITIADAIIKIWLFDYINSSGRYFDLVFRSSSRANKNNSWVMRMYQNYLRLYKVVGGVWTQMDQDNVLIDGDYTIEATLNGNSINIQLGGAIASNVSANDSTWNSNTIVLFELYESAAGSLHIDNFIVEELP